MERKTIVIADEGRQDLYIKRAFDLPVELLFKAYTEADLVAQWMGTKVIRLESKKNGSYQFETSDPSGNVMFRGSGVIHEYIVNEKIVRTFEMENGFDVQLEFLQFESISGEQSKLTIHSIYRSEEMRARQLKLPFAYGINMAHRRLEEVMEIRNKK